MKKRLQDYDLYEGKGHVQIYDKVDGKLLYECIDCGKKMDSDRTLCPDCKESPNIILPEYHHKFNYKLVYREEEFSEELLTKFGWESQGYFCEEE